jgi:DNA-directed RNA polymerase
MERANFTLEQLLTAQEELEREATALGAELFLARVNKAAEKGVYSEAAPVRKLLNTGLTDMTKALTTWLEKAKKQRGVRHTAIKWVELVGPREAAYLALRVVLDGLLETRQEQVVARRISQLLVDELRFRRLKKDAPQAFEYRMREFADKGTTHYRHRANVLMRTAKLEKVDLTDIAMSDTDRIHVGYKLLDIVQTVVGLVESVRVFSNNGRNIESLRMLRPDPHVRDWISKRTDFLAAMCPLALPMVVPPLEWTHDQDGGYRFALRGRYPLVRRAFASKKHSDEAKEVPAVYAALNAAQGTPWRINSQVLDVVRQYRASQLDVPGCEAEETALPARPLSDKPEKDRGDEELSGEELEAREVWRQWSRAAATAHRENKKRSGVGKWLSTIMSVADRMEQYPALYFPHTLDFRGRLYPNTAYMHPQGPDLCRSLLQFAEAVPVGEEGRRWIAIHLANTYDTTPGGQKVSKMPLDERVRWVEENTDAILAVAADPLGNTWWTGAEEPWQCLAACFEWAGVVREGVSYASRLPVAIDGSCNGLQHLAAMLRDERSGRAVNLVPSDMPMDVYTDVSDAAKKLLAGLLTTEDDDSTTPKQRRLRALARDDDMGQRWLASGLIGRKCAKRPTMTVSYGSRVFGFKSQIAEWLRKDVDAAVVREHFTATDDAGKEKKLIGPAAQLMAELLMEAMSDAIAGPMRAMEWMQQCADIVARGKTPIVWTVPVTGWHVEQSYYTLRTRRVKTMLAGETVMPSAAEETDQIDMRRQRNGIAPNVVHSLDAACLMLAVQMARAEGIEAFGLIHDSYACHPSNMPILARAARQAFVRIYTRPVLAQLREQFSTQTKDSLPEVPVLGSLDLGGILVSDFFFS